MQNEEYKRFAAVSLDLSKKAPNLVSKADPLLMAEAWLNLVERTAQLVGHEADEAHRMIDRPLSRASAFGTSSEWVG